MQMKFKFFSLLLFLIFITNFTKAQIQDFDYKACKVFFSKNEEEWEKLISEYQKEKMTIKNAKIGEKLIRYYYAYISLLLKRQEFGKARIYVDKGEKILDKYLEKYPQNATLNSLKAAFIGFHIDLSKLKAIYLAASSNEYVDKALVIDSSNTQAIIDKANILLHTPEIFGGDKKIAIKYYQKAIKIFNKRGENTNNLLYCIALSDLYEAYKRTEQYTQAVFIFNLLEIEKLKYK